MRLFRWPEIESGNGSQYLTPRLNTFFWGVAVAAQKIGTVTSRQDLSPYLAIFRLMPESGSKFPRYKPGQYIALRRENCKLTRRILQPDGKVEYVPDVDAQGKRKYGPVTHSYSIASAPYETEQHGFLEFYVILELQETGEPGRLTESLFQIDPHSDAKITYFEKIAGDFTLDSRAKGFKNVVMVGTGTGLAPFASMVKQLHHEALQGKTDDVRYTLFHANRVLDELAYHKELTRIEKEKKFDFVYIASVSRPTKEDYENAVLGKGRANNLLRSIFDMPLKEEEELQRAAVEGNKNEEMKQTLARTVRPVLPGHVTKNELLDRMNPAETVLLTCGNPLSMADIQSICEKQKIRFEKEDW
jgi:ferredoxin-NADP reductase